jgi:hypothetical protein
MSDPLFTDADLVAMDRKLYPDVDACAQALIAVSSAPDPHIDEMITGLIGKFVELGFEPTEIVDHALAIHQGQQEFWTGKKPFSGGSEIRTPFMYEENK